LQHIETKKSQLGESMRGDLQKGVLPGCFFFCFPSFGSPIVCLCVLVEKEELVALAGEKARATEAVSMTTTLAVERATVNAQVEGDVAQVQACIEEVQKDLAEAQTLYNDAKVLLGRERDRKNALEKELGAAIVKAQGEGAGLEQKIPRLREE